MIYRHVNYRKRAALKKSLLHSLRIKSNKFKSNEWVEQLAGKNWFFTKSSPQGFKLNSQSEESRSAFIAKLISEEFAPKPVSTSVKSNYKKYEYKLNKKIQSVMEAGDEHLALKLTFIRDQKPQNYREIIESIEGVKRRNQTPNLTRYFHGLIGKGKRKRGWPHS
ncbi:hypothetical protein ACL4BT_06305 [Vibrio alginolyticus]